MHGERTFQAEHLAVLFAMTFDDTMNKYEVSK